MKKILMFLVMVCMSFSLVAGDLNKVAAGQGGGRPEKDSDNNLRIQQVYERGITWGLQATLACVSTTSSASAVTVTGASSDYNSDGRPYYLSVLPSGVPSVTYVATTSTVAISSGATTPTGHIITVARGGKIIGPLSYGTYVHFRGLTGPATVGYQIGHVDD